MAAVRGSEMAGLVARTAAWRILQHTYDAMEAKEIEQHLLPVIGKNAVRTMSLTPALQCKFTEERCSVLTGMSHT